MNMSKRTKDILDWTKQNTLRSCVRRCSVENIDKSLKFINQLKNKEKKKKTTEYYSNIIRVSGWKDINRLSTL